jgi:hypothetical protein
MTCPMQFKWDFSQVADRLHRCLSEAEADLRLEQAVYGLDAGDERSLQELLARRLTRFYDVAREVHYPSTAGHRLSNRQRCDLVLTPLGRPLKLDVSPPTLFNSPNVASPEEGLWLEIKVASQFREGGVRHSGYGSQWRDAVVDDLRKMEAEPLIHEAGLALIVFNESRQVLEKDVELFEDVLVRKEVLAGFRQTRSVEILERIGHRLCTMVLWPTIQR